MSHEDPGAPRNTGALGSGGPIQPERPDFDPLEFRKALLTYFFGAFTLFLPGVAAMFLPPETLQRIGEVALWGLPILAIGRPLGLITFSGLAVGVVAVGGCAVGLVAIGGAAVGVLAVGGGALGVVAMGGGAVGYYTLAPIVPEAE